MATSISEAIIPSPVAKVLQWTKQTIAPSPTAAASMEKEGEVVVATPGAVQMQRGLKQSKETEKNEKTKRDRGRQMGAENLGTDKKTGGAADTTPISGGLGKGGKRPKVQLKAEVKFELEVEAEEATQVGVCIQFQSRWEGFTLRQVMKDMVKRSTRYVRRATWSCVGRALRYAASYV